MLPSWRSIHFQAVSVMTRRTRSVVGHFRARYLVTLFQNKSSRKPPSYENELHENKRVGGTDFRMTGFARKLVLTQRQKAIRKWPICLIVLFVNADKMSYGANFLVRRTRHTLADGSSWRIIRLVSIFSLRSIIRKNLEKLGLSRPDILCFFRIKNWHLS